MKESSSSWSISDIAGGNLDWKFAGLFDSEIDCKVSDSLADEGGDIPSKYWSSSFFCISMHAVISKQ